MIDATGLLGLVLLWLFGGDKGKAPPGAAAPPPYAPYRPPTPELPPSPAPAPWPLVVPTDLPRFPGAGWEYDEPPPPAVRQRAAQLVAQLWRTGQGSSKTEQTDGRWITYQAQIVRSGKQGVVAYRIARKPAPALRPPASSAPASSAPASSPGYVPYRPPVPAPVPVQVMPGAPPGIARPLPNIPSAIALPTLRRGDGVAPKAPDPNVRILQQKLGIDDDGRFGPATELAVIAFQRRTGLAPNLTDAQLKARGFGVVKTATWTKLFDVRT